MTIETLATKGFTNTNTGLAGIDVHRLRTMRNAGLRACFKRMEDTAAKLEFVATVRGRQYYNDAASRNVNATWYSMESIQGGLIWIACGTPMQGQEKSYMAIDYSRLLAVVQRKVRMILVLGNADGLRHAFAPVVSTIKECTSMAEALKQAYYYDSPDVKVLFSPATFDPTMPSAVLAKLFTQEVNEL